MPGWFNLNAFLFSVDEIAFLEGMTIVYKSSIDLFLYVVGSAQENEVEWIKFLFFLLKNEMEKHNVYIWSLTGLFSVHSNLVSLAFTQTSQVFWELYLVKIFFIKLVKYC